MIISRARAAINRNFKKKTYASHIRKEKKNTKHMMMFILTYVFVKIKDVGGALAN